MKRTIIVTVWIYVLVVGLFSWMLFGTRHAVESSTYNVMVIDTSAFVKDKKQQVKQDTDTVKTGRVNKICLTHQISQR